MSTQDITNGPADLSQSRFLKACRGEQTDATPVWLMRQAGRYMTEYRELRKKYTILELIKDPALATEVTMQPIQAFDLDAAIIFADILPPLEGMGLQLEFQKGISSMWGSSRSGRSHKNFFVPSDPQSDEILPELDLWG